MCLRQILAAFTTTSDNKALNNRNSGKSTIGINVDAQTAAASPSTMNSEPSLIAKTHGDGSRSDSKGGNRNGGETSSGTKSKEGRSEEEIWAAIKERSKKNAEDYKKRQKALKAKGVGYAGYFGNDLPDYD
ncbi:hypothetical protein V492_03669 [Pseudogymnoascus sp. VKM F-4246]|nr:hypothetical protein V492_03669 [Pseudogymnoascus sp. VKM F-4246]